VSTLATDDFNRANNANLGANWVVNTGNWGITSNAAQASTDDSHASYDGGIIWPNNQWSQATLKATVGPDEHSGTAVTARSQGSGVNSGYELWVGSGGVGIVVVSGGSYTYISTSTLTGFAANDVLYLEAQSTTLLAKKNGATISALTVTDSTFASGKPGIAGGQSGTPFSVDDWSGGDFAAADTLMGQVLT